jgi:hypothetical protein
MTFPSLTYLRQNPLDTVPDFTGKTHYLPSVCLIGLKTRAPAARLPVPQTPPIFGNAGYINFPNTFRIKCLDDECRGRKFSRGRGPDSRRNAKWP